ELIRRDQDRIGLCKFLLDGASSSAAEPADANYFAGLGDRAWNQGLVLRYSSNCAVPLYPLASSDRAAPDADGWDAAGE
ncbi:MAG: hypothetical protein QM636_09240, partial [Rhizobium sp.]